MSAKSNIWPFFSFWLPVAFLAMQAGLELFLPQDALSSMLSEQGPHEALQFLLAFLAALVALRCLWLVKSGGDFFLLFWVLCFVLSCIYIAGEEISWGQHIAEWGTPDFWGQLNDQNETNLHNTSSWLDQKPRLILLTGVFTGGLIIPALARFRPGALPARFKIVYPPASLSFVALCVLGLVLIDKIDEALKDTVIMVRASEIEELYMFYFVLLYLVVLHRRILQRQS
ncbi:MAG: hypothetical protein IT559_08585 [Alphaproteobacteria bacterium]|nr:hypothetical protein [Alphaproteobacteria bacterium]